jgi:hypothetical protein
MKLHLMFLLVIIFASCENRIDDSLIQKQSKTAKDQEIGEPFLIQIGKEVYFKNENLTIMFESVPQDCRCPEGAVCIWAGYVEIALKAVKQGQQPLELKLSTLDGDRDSVAFTGYSLHLVDVTPYPSIERERDTTAYQAELILKRQP